MFFKKGVGFESWENVWGIWNGLVPRDAEALRRISSILRYCGNEGFLTSNNWLPHYPVIASWTIFASQFPHETQNSTVYFFVNRGNLDYNGSQIILDNAGDTFYYYDLYHGVILKPIFSDDNSNVCSQVEGHNTTIYFNQN